VTARRAVASEAPRSLPPLVRHVRSFVLGLVLISVGVALHAVEFIWGMPGMDQMASMENSVEMGMSAAADPSMAMGWLGTLGMGLDLLGLLVAAWAMWPQDRRRPRQAAAEAMTAASPDVIHQARTDAGLVGLDAAPLTRRHWLLMVRLLVSLMLDAMKPATIALMLPGLSAEYHLVPASAALLPFCALVGTSVGSILFGYLADVAGRRMCMVLTTLILAATSICGLMPAFPWQLAMCFVMGLAAGGELPLVYAMLAETMPARHRGWLSVVLGGLGGLGGLLAATGAALLLEPLLGWRSLFLPNLPTALVMLALVRWIPESPRFLLQHGFLEDARRAIRAVGGAFHEAMPTRNPDGDAQRGALRDLLRRPLRGVTITLCLYGLAWGLCNWGFITWLPTMLRGADRSAADVTRLLATSAFLALPGTLVAACLYSVWSSKWTAGIFGAATAGVLVLFASAEQALTGRTELVTLAIVLLLVASSSMNGVLAPYSVELFPTALRGTGTGVVTASSKVGGVVGPGLVGAVLTLAGGLAGPALVVALPVGIASLLVIWRAPETRGKSLEELARHLPVGMAPRTRLAPARVAHD
jgi:MFS transporter, putative metabolite:H+ symporter